MARTDQKLVDLRAELKSGVWLGVPDRLVPVWEDAQNILFNARGILKMEGWSAPFTPTVTRTARGLHQYNNNGILTVVWGDSDSLWSWNSSSVVEAGTGFNGNVNETVITPATTWSIENFGTTLLATNGVDAPQIAAAGTFSDLTDADFTTCEVFLRRGPHLLAFNTSINDKGFVWSSADDLTSWTPSSANSAGDLIIRELDSSIICAVPMGERVAVYGKDQMFLVAYLGSPNYFGYKPAVEGIGAVSKTAVVPVNSKNYGCGRMGFWVTDGVSSQMIDDPAVREYLQADINWSQSSKINGWHDEDNHMVIWYYPSAGGSGEVDKGVGFDYINNLWMPFGFGRTSSVDRDVFSYPLATTSEGDVFYHSFGDDADGTALTAWARTKTFDLDHPDHIKQLHNLRLDWTGTGLTYRIGTRDSLDAAITWTAYSAAPAGYALDNIRSNGRYIAVELYSDQVGDNWEVSGLAAYGKVGGSR